MKKSAVQKGTIAVGKKVMFSRGKSKKTYNAEVIDGGVCSSENPHQDANEVLFMFELAAPAPPTGGRGSPTPIAAYMEGWTGHRARGEAEQPSGCHIQS